MRLSTKITLPVASLIFILILAVTYLAVTFEQEETAFQQQSSKIEQINNLSGRLINFHQKTDLDVLSYEFTPQQTLLEDLEKNRELIQGAIDEITPLLETGRGQELLQKYIENNKGAEIIQNDLIRTIQSGNKEAIALQFNKWSIKSQNIKATLDDLNVYNVSTIHANNTLLNETRLRITRTAILSIAVMLVFLLVFYFYFRNFIVQPLLHLSRAAENVARGDFNTTISPTSNDEIGRLSVRFNDMTRRLRDSYTFLAEKVEEKTEELEKKMEEISLEKAKDEAILASIGEGLIATDQQGKIIFMNEPASSMTLQTNREWRKLSWSDVLTLETEAGRKIPPSLQPITMAFLSRKMTHANNYFCRRKNGTRFPINLTCTPILLNDDIIGAIAVFRDITHEKEIDRAKSEFVSLASHQLRTPITAISWYTEMLLSKETGPLSEEQLRYMQYISSSNERMIQLVNSLLNVSRIELGSFTVDPVWVQIDEIINGVIDELRPQLERKPITINRLVEKNLPSVYIDPNLMRIIIQNLIANSVKYTPSKGEISITTRLSSNSWDKIIVSVADNGYGIPKDQQPKIFTKLFRASNVTTKDTDGTGLGLYLVKSIVDTIGGTIWFESQENRGTTFFVSFPIQGVKKRAGKTLLSQKTESG